MWKAGNILRGCRYVGWQFGRRGARYRARVEKQIGSPPFNSRDAVRRFAGILREYKIAWLVGDGTHPISRLFIK
jgi:hypothetical protein